MAKKKLPESEWAFHKVPKDQLGYCAKWEITRLCGKKQQPWLKLTDKAQGACYFAGTGQPSGDSSQRRPCFGQPGFAALATEQIAEKQDQHGNADRLVKKAAKTNRKKK